MFSVDVNTILFLLLEVYVSFQFVNTSVRDSQIDNLPWIKEQPFGDILLHEKTLLPSTRNLPFKFS